MNRLFTCIALAGASCGATTMAAELPTRWFGSQKMLTCGPYRFEAVTTCAGGDDVAEPYCFKQTFTFGNVSARPYRTITLHYHPKAELSELVTGADCINVESKHYIVLSGTNFGNCREGCEWLDFFTGNGKYLGSTPNLAKASTFRRRDIYRSSPKLARKLHKHMQNEKPLERFDIHRAE